jgi:hypothetical protein
MTRGSSLSDEQVIEKVNKEFVAVEINITDQGFPKDVEGLKPWENAFNKDPRYEVAFTTSVVIGPGGKSAFGTAGCGHKEDWKDSASYHPEKYIRFLEASLDRYSRAKAIAEDKNLSQEERMKKLKEIQAECLKAISEAAKCKRKK